MIGLQMASLLLNKKTLEFYKVSVGNSWVFNPLFHLINFVHTIDCSGAI